MEQSEMNLLNEIKEISLDNNKKLATIVKQNKIALWTKVLYWAVIILLTIGAFKVIGPMLAPIKAIYMPTKGTDTLDSLDLLSNPSIVNSLKNQIQGE